jgi:Holliday junction resolvasome RuvABC endonuclease subunit
LNLEIEVVSQKQKNKDVVVDVIEIYHKAEITTPCIGIDPGTVNLGIAVLSQNGVGWLYQYKLVRNTNAVSRIETAYSIGRSAFSGWNGKAVIEGASYGSNFRQVELAEQRAAIVLGMKAGKGFDTVSIVAPLMIRKAVFGSGKVKGEHYWEDVLGKQMTHMGAALACAFYGITLVEQEKTK